MRGDRSPVGHRRHALVDQAQAFLGPAKPDQGLPLLVHPEGDQVGVVEAPADLLHLPGRCQGPLFVAGLGLGEQVGNQEVPLLGAVRLIGQQALRPPQPSKRRGDLADEA